MVAPPLIYVHVYFQPSPGVKLSIQAEYPSRVAKLISPTDQPNHVVQARPAQAGKNSSLYRVPYRTVPCMSRAMWGALCYFLLPVKECIKPISLCINQRVSKPSHLVQPWLP